MIKYVSSKENKYVKLARQLSQKKTREKTNLFILEGIRSLEDALRSDYNIKTILINSTFKDNIKAQSMLSKVGENVTVLEIENNLFKDLALTETPQGVLTIAEQKHYELESILDQYPQIIIIADGIQDPGNMGTIIRTSAAAGANALLTTKGCVDIYNPKVVRASMGGIFFIPIIQISNLESLLTSLQQKHYRIVVADLEGSQLYYEADLKRPVALVIGNENNGPSQLFKERADLILKIPMLGEVESLNAGVAAGILIYDIVRQNLSG